VEARGCFWKRALAGRWAMAVTCARWMGDHTEDKCLHLDSVLSNLNLGFSGPEPFTGLVRWAKLNCSPSSRRASSPAKWCVLLKVGPLYDCIALPHWQCPMTDH